MTIVFRLIFAEDLRELRSWFEDAELSRRLSYPTDEWFAYVTNGGIAQCWIAQDDDEPVAQLQVDHVVGEPAYLDIAVRPNLRGKRLGQSILTAFLTGAGSIYSVVVGHIEPDNLASLRCCQRCGFVLSDEVDEGGFIRAEFNRNS